MNISTPVAIRRSSTHSPASSVGPSERGGGGGGAGSVRLTPGPSAEQRRARREQLREFYGIKGGVGAGDGGENEKPGRRVTRREPEEVDRVGDCSGGRVRGEEGEGGQGDPLDLDSPAFNASKYYEDLIGRASLEELMKTSAKLSMDIHNLQGSRHSLVYNHHHQLFAAGDTISVLNSRTPQLISIVSSLQDSFSSISQLADSVAIGESNADNQSQDNEAVERERVERAVERMRLMKIAEMDPGRIRQVWEAIRERVEGDAQDRKEGAEGQLRECREILDGLHVDIEPTADTPAQE